MKGCTPQLHLQKHTAPRTHIKLLLTHTREFTDTHGVFLFLSLPSGVEVLGGGERAGIMDLIQEGREEERRRGREGGVGEREREGRERWEVRGRRVERGRELP